MVEDLKTKHLAEAGYLGSKAREEALADRAAGQSPPGIQYHGVRTGRFPPPLIAGRTTHTVHPILYMVAVGGLSEGFQFYGTFTEDKYAARWAYNNLKRGIEYRVYPIFDTRNDA